MLCLSAAVFFGFDRNDIFYGIKIQKRYNCVIDLETEIKTTR